LASIAGEHFSGGGLKGLLERWTNALTGRPAALSAHNSTNATSTTLQVSQHCGRRYAFRKYRCQPCPQMSLQCKRTWLSQVSSSHSLSRSTALLLPSTRSAKRCSIDACLS
jgi:hypothetical protein